MDNQMSSFRESLFPEHSPLYDGLLFTTLDLYFDLSECDQVRETLDVFSEIEIRGRVTDPFGLPVKGAMIEMWHHEKWGLYRMEFEPSCVPVDPDGQGWEMAVTDENGEYFFKTEKRLTADGQEATPINFKVTDENGHITLAKLYPTGELKSCADPYFNSLEMEERCQCMGRRFDEGIEFDINTTQV